MAKLFCLTWFKAKRAWLKQQMLLAQKVLKYREVNMLQTDAVLPETATVVQPVVEEAEDVAEIETTIAVKSLLKKNKKKKITIKIKNLEVVDVAVDAVVEADLVDLKMTKLQKTETTEIMKKEMMMEVIAKAVLQEAAVEAAVVEEVVLEEDLEVDTVVEVAAVVEVDVVVAVDAVEVEVAAEVDPTTVRSKICKNQLDSAIIISVFIHHKKKFILCFSTILFHTF